MKKGVVRSIYSQELDIRCGALHVRRLCLNRHLPEKDWVAPHRHGFSQFLVYLTGRGVQQIADSNHPVRPGCVCYLPPQVDHAFVETTGRRPLCLAVDLSMPARETPGSVFAHLTQAEINTIRHALSGLSRWQTGPSSVEPREAAAVFQLLDVLLRSTSLLPRSGAGASATIVHRVQRAIEADESASVAKVAEAVGYHRDHLNRLLKDAAGVSIGGLRAEIQLRRAKLLLKTTRQIGDAAAQLGFADPNYFSRWFRQQTGMSPGRWRNQSAGAPRVRRG